ncbi:MAG TPA: DUF167 domain-containing protein [Acidimicrobiia bacterium]|nr:DUF167 domain-containing protein [Acidimicrobiia bacterium]
MGERSWWAEDDGGIQVSVRVTTGARRSELMGAAGERLRVRVAARAVEGQANVELQRLVAKRFGVRRSAVSIVRGERSREKSLRIAGLTAPPADILEA